MKLTNFKQFCFMSKTGITPSVFSDICRPKPTNKYPLRSTGTLPKPYYKRKYSEFIKSFRESHMGKSIKEWTK